MLNPRAYPELVAKALVLDEEPFVALADDDDPWVEGLAIITIVSLIAGLAKTIGSLLTAASLPAPDLVYNMLVQTWRQFATIANVASAQPAAEAERAFSQLWTMATLYSGYAGGWSHLTLLISTPTLALLWWVLFGLMAFAAARILGGQGSLTATLGTTALAVAPMILQFLTFVPFVSVSGALVTLWGLLIAYRGIQIAQELPWQKAALAAIIPFAAVLIAIMLLVVAFGAGYTAGGFR